MSTPKKYSFRAILENDEDDMDTAFIKIPLDVKKEFGTNGMVKIAATFDGHPYRGVLANMGGGCHLLGVRKDIRKAIRKGVGDPVKVTIRQDMQKRVVEVPAMLLKLLKKNPLAKNYFDSLSFSNRKEYAVWIGSAKKEETREKRLGLAIKKLLAKKRNPFEK